MCTVGKKEGEERWSEREIPAISPPFILWAQMSSPNEKKMRCSQPGKKAFCPFTCSPCLSSARRSVAALFPFHLPITSVLLLVGVPGSRSHQSQMSHRRTSAASGTQSASANSWTAQQRHCPSIADKYLLWCIFSVGFCGLSQTPFLQCVRAAAVLCIRKRERVQKKEQYRKFSKRHRKCGRLAKGAQTHKGLLILSSTFWHHS